MTVVYGRRLSAHQVLLDLTERRRIPLSALVQTTFRCNESCIHCMQVKRGGPELTTADWARVFQRLADAGVLFLTLTGGEPTVREDWLELLRIARGMSFALKLKTNGFRLDERACDEVSRLPVMEVHFSFYSVDPAVHDGITRTPGSHARVVAAARRLRKNGTRVLLNCPLMIENADGYERVIAFAEAEGMDYAFDPGIIVQEDGCTEPARHRMPEEAHLRLLSDPRIYEPKEPGPANEKLGQPVCRVGKAMVAVAPNGDVWPCLSIREKLGNLLESDLESIWVGNPILEKYASIRWQDLPKCRECELLRYCSRCHANAMLEDGDLYGPSCLACHRARLFRTVTERRRKGRSG